MQSSTPSQARRSTKRRKIVPAVDPDVFETIVSFPGMLADMSSNDPVVRSRAVQRLTVLSPLMQQLALTKKTAGVHYAAGKFKSLDQASSLSADVDTIIQRLQSSRYHRIDRSEASVRVIVELLILDRLYHLSAKGALEYLQLYPEVDVDLLLGDTHVSGHTDWLLCYDDPRDSIDATLIAIEAKRGYEFSLANSQMATYLAAIQASRARIQKIHAIAFRITTDSNAYQFWFIDSERRLFSSVSFEWRLHKAKIIAWIDKMLAEAIEASPLTTLTLRRNISLRNWEKDFRRRQLLSSESNDSPLTEGLPFDIIVPESCHLVARAWYQGRKVMVVEYEEEEEEEESGGDDEEDGENCAISG
ncbi:hypothetical protein N7447_006542 [Penicillium robsamsonii]|uniref:uncharacterized protein n=1 Tax=Penicillium robsamsonii TaxID=1792511 RepID=UPI002548DD1D|nr:uncharacterized protein N7447_006542 [Penicillium robsamsonii]KAJ5824202.1 hypothetical protein N7447_006542 [Penicillium robsamsonii]